MAVLIRRLMRPVTQRTGTGRLRRIAATAATGILLAGLAVAPSAAGAVRLTGAGDWSYGSYGDANSYGNGYGNANGYDPYGSSGGSGGLGGSSGTATADARAATSSESQGVVLIDTQLYDGSEAAGTGIVLTKNGEVLTNYHVVEGSTSITVTVASTGASYTATLVGADEGADVAVLQLKNASGLTTADLDDDTTAVGDDVTAVGNAGGTGELSAADGEVTALDAQITTTAEGSVAGETLSGLIETDADVVAGDSGGPLLDSAGEVVGIDTAASTGSQIDGYAIPIDDAMTIVDQIEAGNETGQVRIGPAAYLGVQVTDSSDSPGTGTSDASSSSGATVAGVEHGTPAAAAGLTAGDVIIRVGSATIGSTADLTEALASRQPGDRVTITWLDSSGDHHSASVTLGESPVN